MNDRPRRLRVLCIEDHPLDREILRRQLEQSHVVDDTKFDIHFAPTLGEAIMLMQSRDAFDVCIVDLYLPDSRGIETLHALRKFAQDVAIVVVTGDSDVAMLRQAIYANVHSYLVKGEYSSGAIGRAILAAWERAQLERRVAEATELVRQSQAQYRALIEFLPDAVIMTNADGRILYLNPAAQELLGRTSGELVGEELLSPRRVGISGDIVIARSDGHLRYVVLRTQYAVVDGKHVHLYFLHDVTERRTLETQLRAFQRSELLGVLASGIAHDLNNLLAPIMLGVQTLLRMPHDQRTGKVLSMIEQSARRGADLIKQMLSYARSQDGQQHQPIAPARLVADVLRLHASRIPASITVDTSGLADDAPTFYADYNQMIQILLNLFANAIDAIGDQEGKIRLAAYRTESTDPRLVDKGISDTSYLVFEVADTGHGIPEEVRTRIFEPFFTTRQGAAGLGLYTVLAIVKRHRGTLHVESSSGKGTCVSVFFPLEETAQHATKTTVLVVSPSTTVRNLVRTTLEDVGAKVLEASTTAEALTTFIKVSSEVDIIVADDDEHIRIDTDKLSAIKQLKPNIHIVALCPLIVDEHVVALDGTVVDTFIPKPFTDRMILDALAPWLSRANAQKSSP
ncbi:MAG: ATP-binding protein [Chlorobi bacterium]|nr:ATP-binding protein [Chlorobiota bacterium]